MDLLVSILSQNQRTKILTKLILLISYFCIDSFCFDLFGFDLN